MVLDTKDFDPLAYIESAFLDKQPKAGKLPTSVNPENSQIELPNIGSYLNGSVKDAPAAKAAKTERARFRKTEMRAPRPRRVKDTETPPATIDPSLQTVWESLP